jgi:hypothetical protein
MVDLKKTAAAAGKNNNNDDVVSGFLSLKSNDTSFRPVGIKFNNKENALYVVSMGKFEVRTTLPNGTPLPMPTPWAYADTGVVWKIMRSGGSAGSSSGGPMQATKTTGSSSTTAPPPSTGVPGVP